MGTNTDSELHAIVTLKPGVNGAHSIDNVQTGVHRAHGIVFVDAGIATVDENTIAQRLGDMTPIVFDRAGHALLVYTYYLTQLFRIELAGKAN